MEDVDEDTMGIAGATITSTVQLPRSCVTLIAFVQDTSLAILFNLQSHLEEQGLDVLEVKEQ